MPSVSSDPHAWLRPIYARLRADSSFSLLAPAHQFEVLRQAAAEEAPSKAESMREWNTTTQFALLGWLADVAAQQPNPSREVELWRVRKGERELRCSAVHLHNGVDLRLLEGGEFRRTQLLKDAPAVQALAQKWREALGERGWESRSASKD